MNRRALFLTLLGAALSLGSSAARADDAVIVDTNTAKFQVGEITKDNKKIPAGTVEQVDGKVGKAAKLSFVEGASGGFIITRVRSNPEWSQADGFSFWVKGDGSDTFGGIELIDRDDFSLRYGYCFPIDSTEWRKIVVPWRDVIPELAGPLVGGKHGFDPANFGNFFFGKWFYWREYPANSFAIDHIALEKKIASEPEIPVEPGIARFAAKLRQHKPVTIVTMGDSLTDIHHWSNKTIRWPDLLAKDLKAKYGSEVTIVNPAIGGTTLSQNLIIMPRWGKTAPSPDLVTVWFGGNDWNSNVRGPRFTEYLQLGVDKIRRQTKGNADVLLMTTCPGFANWETMHELEDAARNVAKEKKTGLADVAAEFRKAATPEEAMKRGYWADDKVHLGAKGHEVTKDTILRLIEAQK